LVGAVEAQKEKERDAGGKRKMVATVAKKPPRPFHFPQRPEGPHGLLEKGGPKERRIKATSRLEREASNGKGGAPPMPKKKRKRHGGIE